MAMVMECHCYAPCDLPELDAIHPFLTCGNGSANGDGNVNGNGDAAMPFTL